MLLLYMYTGDGAVGVTTMLSLVAMRVVFVTACGATGRCGVVTLTAPLCSSVHTLRIYMPSDRGQGRHVYVVNVLLYYYQWLSGWSSLFRLMPFRNMFNGYGAVGVTTMSSRVASWVVFVTACGAAGRCGVVTLTAPLCSSVYTLRILIVLISINSTHIHVHWGWGCRRDDYVVACGAASCTCDSLRCHR